MKLYRHYKNKPYKYLGEARHSETEEDYVIYDVLYKNNGPRTWIRPKKMFFESVEADGRSVPRFAPVQLEVQEHEVLTEAILCAIEALSQRAFDEPVGDLLYDHLRSQRRFFVLLAHIEGKPIGYKLGYEETRTRFYSWLGGVDSDFRGLGVAEAMMRRQHEWCRAQGYQTVRTKTQNRFRGMLLLNLKAGFEIIGTQSKDGGKLSIILEKKLS